jgi:hypothetical protein
MSDAEREFRLEEFRQLHEHIRTFENAISTIVTVLLPACITLLTAISAWFFEMHRTGPDKVAVPLCYLFLSPALLSVLTLILISSYKTAVYRNGYYIKTFFEEAGEGARWHIDLVEYRKLKRVWGEHGDPVAVMLWALYCISVLLFFIGLSGMDQLWHWHVIAPAALGLLMLGVHLLFVGNRKRIDDTWHLVRSRKPAARPEEWRFEKAVRPATGESGDLP